jgi:spore maturation protein SpmA
MILNYICILFFAVSFVVALYKWIILGDAAIFTTVTTSIFDNTKTAAEISIGLIGTMTFWLGMMEIGNKAGLIRVFSQAVSPFFSKLFPQVPATHPAMGSVMMNFSANMLGLDNAATPIGLKAMQELQTLNPDKTTATDAQIMFLVLNTAGITLIPTSVMAIRLANHAANPADIFIPTLIGTFISFVSGLIAVSFYQKINLFRPAILAFFGLFAGIIGGLYIWLAHLPAAQISSKVATLGSLVLFGVLTAFMVFGFIKKINVYDAFIQGAKSGFETAVGIIPYLVIILVAVGCFRAVGCMDFVMNGIGSLVVLCGLNADFVPALPVGLMKTLSGGGARALMIDVLQTYGADSFQGRLACIIQGSTETTFYVLAVYFGSVGITNSRYAIVCGLIADLVGLVAAIIIGYAFFH